MGPVDDVLILESVTPSREEATLIATISLSWSGSTISSTESFPPIPVIERSPDDELKLEPFTSTPILSAV